MDFQKTKKKVFFFFFLKEKQGQKKSIEFGRNETISKAFIYSGK